MTATSIVEDTSLKAIASRKELFAAVQAVGHAVSGRSTLPILSHIIVRADSNGLLLAATDLELGISCRVKAQIQEIGAFTAPSKTLIEVLGNLPDKAEVAVSVDRSHTVRCQCERSDYKILGLPAEEYPELPEVQDAVSFLIPLQTLKEMIRCTIFAASTDETRPILTGVLLSLEGDSLKMVATDTHRLAVATVPILNGKGSQNSVVPARALNELIRLLTDDEGSVHVSLSQNQICFSLPGESQVQIISRLIEGQFPNFQRVIPQEHYKRLTVPTQPMLSAVRRASIIARDSSSAHRIVLHTKDNSLILTAENPIVGSAYEELEIIREGEEVEIAFNAAYLLDVLSIINEEAIALELTESLKPGMLKPVPDIGGKDNDASSRSLDYLCVLMPMQLL